MKLFLSDGTIIPDKPHMNSPFTTLESLKEWQLLIMNLANELESRVQQFIDDQFGFNQVHVIEEQEEHEDIVNMDTHTSPRHMTGTTSIMRESNTTMMDQDDADQDLDIFVKTEESSTTISPPFSASHSTKSRSTKSKRKRPQVVTRNAGSTFRRLSQLSPDLFPPPPLNIVDHTVSHFPHLMEFPFRNN
jgi:uncharacterized protein (DUF1697 family)